MADKVQGSVKWFSNKKGYGFITPAEGSPISEDIFVHQSSIHCDGYRTLVSIIAPHMSFVPFSSDPFAECAVLLLSLFRTKAGRSSSKSDTTTTAKPKPSTSPHREEDLAPESVKTVVVATAEPAPEEAEVAPPPTAPPDPRPNRRNPSGTKSCPTT